MTLEEYLNYIPTEEEKQEKRLSFVRVHTNTPRVVVSDIVAEVQRRLDISSSRTLH